MPSVPANIDKYDSCSRPGDIVVVEPVPSIDGIGVDYETGDTICFRNPRSSGELIIHRAAEKMTDALRHARNSAALTSG